MTEGQWLTCSQVKPMLNYLTKTPGVIYKTKVQQHPRGRRRLRLFGVAVTRRVLHLVADPKLLELHAAAEAFADGTGTIEDLDRLRVESSYRGFSCISDDMTGDRFHDLLNHQPRAAFATEAVGLLGARDAHSSVIGYNNAAVALCGEHFAGETALQCDLFRDVFGNPFRKTEFDKSWRTSTVKALAKQMYDSREFGAMPILADALQDAGCDDEAILAHCREPREHVRGCWVIDLVLGKS